MESDHKPDLLHPDLGGQWEPSPLPSPLREIAAYQLWPKVVASATMTLLNSSLTARIAIFMVAKILIIKAGEVLHQKSLVDQ